MNEKESTVKMIPIEQIHILNPRARNQKIFRDIAENITKVGLKRPITVTPAKECAAGKDYNLVCGQGRIEAFMACGQTKIPAIVIDASESKALIMSLVENLARRRPRPLDLLLGIEALLQKGYDARLIATKTGLKEGYVRVILGLLAKGEERLLAAVEAGHIPVSVAVSISSSPNDQQRALQLAYENNELRGGKLMLAKRLLEKREQLGKTFQSERSREKRNGLEKTSSQDVLNTYKKEVDRKRLLTRRANLVNARMASVIEALRILYAQEQFCALLNSENLTTMPKQILALIDLKS